MADKPIEPSGPAPRKKTWKSRAWLAFKIVAGLVILAHLYALSLRLINPPGTILMMQRSSQGEDIQRKWVKLEEMSPYIVQAVLAGEDGRFCQHRGIDWEAIETAIEDNKEGGRRRGGSTITQQTAKNVFFWNGGGYIRKVGEAWFASLIDAAWGKPRVMEVYLNVAEWGDGIFGIEMAAQKRFGKSAMDLTQREAALLAAVLPSPNKWRVDPPGQYVSGRASTLQQRMAVIRNSGYDNCVYGKKAPPPPAATKPATPKRETLPEKDKPAEEPANSQPSALEDVLQSAEDSLKDTDASAESETDMTETPKPQPTEIPAPSEPASIPAPTPTPRPEPAKTPEVPAPNDPANIPAPKPTPRPEPVKTPEIPQEITPDQPQEIPQEIPDPSPPTEIPNEIGAERADTPKPEF